MMGLELRGIELLFDTVVYKITGIEAVHCVGECDFEIDDDSDGAVAAMRDNQFIVLCIESKAFDVCIVYTNSRDIELVRMKTNMMLVELLATDGGGPFHDSRCVGMGQIPVDIIMSRMELGIES